MKEKPDLMLISADLYSLQFLVGCDFFPGVRGFWENFRQFIPLLRFFFYFLFFLIEISSRKLIPLLRPSSVHSGSSS